MEVSDGAGRGQRRCQQTVGIDPTRASVARVYDYMLGGKDNYEVDRQTYAEMAAALPEVVEVARENRAFLTRVVRFIATQTGITQYLDSHRRQCPPGRPTTRRESKVVYVDNDPVVIAHVQALLAENELTAFVEGDAFQPRAVLDHEVVRAHLDWTEPIALFQLATLHHHKGTRHQAADVMHEYIDALPSGSYVAISHLLEPESDDSTVARELSDAVARGSLGGATWRTHNEISELFDGLDLVEPGLVELMHWWPDGPKLSPTTVAHRIIARKP